MAAWRPSEIDERVENSDENKATYSGKIQIAMAKYLAEDPTRSLETWKQIGRARRELLAGITTYNSSDLLPEETENSASLDDADIFGAGESTAINPDQDAFGIISEDQRESMLGQDEDGELVEAGQKAVVEVEDEEGAFSIDSILETDDEEPISAAVDKDHITIIRRIFTPFGKLISQHHKSGSDVYTRSFQLERLEGGFVSYRYNNDMVFAELKAKTVINQSQLQGTWVVDVASFLKAISSANGTHLPLVADKKGSLFAHIYGGELYLQTQSVSQKSYTLPDVGDALSEIKLTGGVFLKLLSSLLTLSSSGSRAEERAVYFDPQNAYVYSGSVIGKFPGQFADMTLQNADVNSVLGFFDGVKSPITLRIYKSHVGFSTEDRNLLLTKKKLQLDDQIKETAIEVQNGIRLDPQMLYDIARILESQPTSGGVAMIKKSTNGVTLQSKTRSQESQSDFPIYAEQVGSGLSRTSVRVGLKTLKSYLNAFDGMVVIDIRGEKLYIKGESGSVVITGTTAVT